MAISKFHHATHVNHKQVSNGTGVPTISFAHQTAAWGDGHSVFGILGLVWCILKILWTYTSSNAVLAQVLFNSLGMGVVWWTWDGCSSFDLGWVLFSSCCSCVFVFFFLTCSPFVVSEQLGGCPQTCCDQVSIMLGWRQRFGCHGCRHKPNGCNVLLHFWLSQWGHRLCWSNIQPSLKILQNAVIT